MGNETLGPRNGEVARLEEANKSLAVTVSVIGEVTEEILRLGEFSERTRFSIEFIAGKRIGELMQEHINTFLAEGTSHRIHVRISDDVELYLNDGQLYRTSSRSERSRNSWPQTDDNWFRY